LTGDILSAVIFLRRGRLLISRRLLIGDYRGEIMTKSLSKSNLWRGEPLWTLFFILLSGILKVWKFTDSIWRNKIEPTFAGRIKPGGAVLKFYENRC